jgi:thiol:disulfide interchange protein
MNPKLWHLINVRLISAIVLTCLTLLTVHPASAQDDSVFKKPAHHTQVKLLLSADTVKPGDTIYIGVDMQMEAGWHTYWKNPGDAGSATEIKWQLPPGITAGDIQWPLPEKLPPIEVTTYGYENETMLIVPLTIATNFSGSEIDLKANVSWLECKDVCIPANQDVETKLSVGGETKSSGDAAAIDSWQKKVPPLASEFHARAFWLKPAEGDLRQLEVKFAFSPKPDAADFYPNANTNTNQDFEVQPQVQWQPDKEDGWIQMDKTVKKFSGNWPQEISGVIVLETGSTRQGFEIKIPVTDEVPAAETVPATINSNSHLSSTPLLPLWQVLLYAFIGGLILNIMPCVLPVIALKILGFVSEARSEPRRVRMLGAVYAVGVLCSFLTLAAVVIGVKTAGHQAGWGMQFGSPIFIVCLTTLVTLVALNLFGVFEVTPGGSALDKANELASKHGAAGAFFNGVLATTLATPCTAPFLAPALGFAFSQSAPTIILVFLTVGLGLASPYVVLSWNPAWLKFLPKPGAWMEKFKIAMGFPMLATVVWLFNLAASSYGKNVLWLGVFLVTVAAAAWVFGEFFQRGQKRKGLALVVTLILLGVGYVYALEKNLDWRNAMPPEAGSLKESADGIDWQPWSPEAVAAARSAGHPVIVDFTADWCLTCQVNKKTSIEIASVRKKIKDANIVALLADDTHTPQKIAVELQRFNRAGVPMVLVYPKNPDAQPIVLPEVLTPGIVLDALAKAAD